MREASRLPAYWLTRRFASHRLPARLRWIVAAAALTAPLLGSHIVEAQEPSNDAVSISPVPMVHVLHPGSVPPIAGAAASRIVDSRTHVAGAVSAGLQINPTFDVSITSDTNAAAIEATINAAIANIESQFSDPITVNITFQKGGGLGGSATYFGNLSYATFLAALKADAKTVDDATAVGLLPNVATNPVNGNATINVKTANLRAVGIAAAVASDGTVSVNTAITSPGSPGSTLQYSLLTVVEHEIDEVLGLGSSLPDVYSGTIFPEDLYRYSGPNARTFTSTDSRVSLVGAFFSINATTPLAEFDNQNDGGDFGDWQSNPLRSGVVAKVQDAFAAPGVNPDLGVELTALDVVGYDRLGGLTVSRRPLADFDGDSKSDVAVFRPATGVWYILNSSPNFTTSAAYQWGVSTDIPVPGDYDGDGKTDVAVYRPANGYWYILQSSTNFTTYSSGQWGASTDIPVPGDYDGDGKTDVAVYRPANGNWYILRSSTSSYVGYQWGASTDIPVLKPPL
jgi:hypothetical protein